MLKLKRLLYKLLRIAVIPSNGEVAKVLLPIREVLYNEAYSHLGKTEKDDPKFVAMVNRKAANCHIDGQCWLPDLAHWCGSFVGHCILQVGLHVPKNYFRAKSWIDYGYRVQPLSTAQKGDIVVLTRKGGGHVALFDHFRDDKVYLLGGNQSNSVSIGAYPRKSIIGIFSVQ